MEIMTFKPLFKSLIWGGDRIAPFKGVETDQAKIGESWELSCVPGNESIVANGENAGKNLKEMLELHGEEIMGKRLYELYGNKFPLLIKLIDSADDLSIQVHPDDKLAGERHNCPGKTEMWISVDPAEGAYLYSGFNREISIDEYRERIANNTIVETLGLYNPAKGSVFFLPAGRVHSIGKGNFILEIQQTSDITYRIYDFDRRDAEGNPRQLHVEESIDAVNYGDIEGAAPSYISGKPGVEEEIADCEYFTTTAIAVDGEIKLDLSGRDSFTVLISMEGNGTIIDGEGKETELGQGSAALVPATVESVTIKGDCKIITTYIR